MSHTAESIFAAKLASRKVGDLHTYHHHHHHPSAPTQQPAPVLLIALSEACNQYKFDSKTSLSRTSRIGSHCQALHRPNFADKYEVASPGIVQLVFSSRLYFLWFALVNFCVFCTVFCDAVNGDENLRTCKILSSVARWTIKSLSNSYFCEEH